MTLSPNSSNSELTQKRQEIVCQYLDVLQSQTLERIIQAEKWCSQLLVNRDGARCLEGHTFDYQYQKHKKGWQNPASLRGLPVSLVVQEDKHLVSVAVAFDKLVQDQGLETTVQWVKQEARRVLEERKA